MAEWQCILLFVCCLLNERCRAADTCYTPLQISWSRELSAAPFAAPLAVADLDGDGQNDIIAASFDGQVHAVHASTGSPLAGSWPAFLPHTSLHSRPLIYDVDADGTHNVLVVSSHGSVVALQPTGETVRGYGGQLPPLYVQTDWYNHTLSADRSNVHDFISESPTQGHIPLDPHVLADAVLVELGRTGVRDTLLVPVSYYLDPDDYPYEEELHGVRRVDWHRYLASALVVYDLEAQEPVRTLHLELTSRDLVYPGYVLAAPMLVDLNGTASSEWQVIVGSAAGRLHVVYGTGTALNGFPLVLDSVQTEVAIGDVDGDGRVEIVVVDISGNVACVDSAGDLRWETSLDGDWFSAPQLMPASDGTLSVVITADTGLVHVLNGSSGTELSGWPFKVGRSIKVAPMVADGHITVLASGGHLHMLSADTRCRHTIQLAEATYVPLVSVGDGALLVATMDGALVRVEREQATQLSDGGGLDLPADITGTSFQVNLYLSELPTMAPLPYRVNLYIGRQLSYTGLYQAQDLYDVHIPTPVAPIRAHVQVVILDRYGQVISDRRQLVHFHGSWQGDVAVVLLYPMLLLCGVLLVNFGFPEAHLLPFTTNDKER